MQAFWIEFEDGSKACCEGQSAGDAAAIAEHVSGKRVKRKSGHEDAKTWRHEHLEIDKLPYPATPRIWAFEHPVNGVHPAFCFKPNECKGRGACPRPRACDD